MLALMLVAPTQVFAYMWERDELVRIPLPADYHPDPAGTSADLDFDGFPEEVFLKDGTVTIQRGSQRLWHSPEPWEVVQTQITDLNRDGELEVALLVWRDFAPWPVDRYLVYPGRIDGFHNRDGRSCHMILIGWRKGTFRELWAGSAQADPFTSMFAADLDGDGWQELVALEQAYDASINGARSLTVWEWNGFGFSLLSQSPAGRITALTPAHAQGYPQLILTHGFARRLK